MKPTKMVNMNSVKRKEKRLSLFFFLMEHQTIPEPAIYLKRKHNCSTEDAVYVYKILGPRPCDDYEHCDLIKCHYIGSTNQCKGENNENK